MLAKDQQTQLWTWGKRTSVPLWAHWSLWMTPPMDPSGLCFYPPYCNGKPQGDGGQQWGSRPYCSSCRGRWGWRWSSHEGGIWLWALWLKCCSVAQQPSLLVLGGRLCILTPSRQAIEAGEVVLQTLGIGGSLGWVVVDKPTSYHGEALSLGKSSRVTVQPDPAPDDASGKALCVAEDLKLVPFYQAWGPAPVHHIPCIIYAGGHQEGTAGDLVFHFLQLFRGLSDTCFSVWEWKSHFSDICQVYIVCTKKSSYCH